MKILFMNGKQFRADKPGGKDSEELNDCVIAFITVEKKDSNSVKLLTNVSREFSKICKLFDSNNIMLVPFSHLSKHLLDKEAAKELIFKIAERLREKYHLVLSEFGVEKGLMLELKISEDNIKYREF